MSCYDGPYSMSTCWTTRRAVSFLVAAVAVPSLFGSTAADCDCGYSTTIDGQQHFFTDLIETDFAHLFDLSTNTDWIRQAFNNTSEQNRGTYGEMFSIENLYTNPNSNSTVEDGTDASGSPTGLDLVVRASVDNGSISVAEIDSNRTDILYGTFRVGMRLTNVAGTCSAFFWYFNDTQEIDMEFLSTEYNASNGSYPVNLVIQSRLAAEMGFDAQRTPDYIKTDLPFDPTADFHEYRFDFLPDLAVFYADNQTLGKINGSDVPSHAGHLSLSHWSNGNRLWSGGPPAQDAITTVSYVKAYFNSSSSQRQSDWRSRCPDMSAPNAICAIPEVTATNDTAADWFFSNQDNMTNNQTVSGQDSSGASQSPSVLLLALLATAFTVTGCGLGIW